jgi:hypothetical protein
MPLRINLPHAKVTTYSNAAMPKDRTCTGDKRAIMR